MESNTGKLVRKNVLRYYSVYITDTHLESSECGNQEQNYSSFAREEIIASSLTSHGITHYLIVPNKNRTSMLVLISIGASPL
ncbi:MAG: hypothetical protein NUV80_07120 [Candidatus Berkelbacteria bacterium]|nr:hypothetical protein [Candidatus Berkelbacteria bacterium]